MTKGRKLIMMEALHPGHANRLLAYDLDPAGPTSGTSVGQELDTWYRQNAHDILARPIGPAEIDNIRLLFSSIADPELVALCGLWSAAKLSNEPDNTIVQQINNALPSARAGIEGYEETEQVVRSKRHQALRCILRPRRSFLRSIVETGPAAAGYRISKGAIYTSDVHKYPDEIYEAEEIPMSDIALLTAHEVLIRRLGTDSPRYSRLPLEYSVMHRQLDGKQFSDIDAAHRYIENLANKGCFIRNMNEPYQQGLLSIVQSCSMFPDIMDRYQTDDRAGFCAMLRKVTQLWPTPGLHGAIGQGGFIFRRGLLRYEDGNVQVDDLLTSGLAELPTEYKKIQFHKDFRVPLYIGRRATAIFQPLRLPLDKEDDSPIPGTIAFHGGSPDRHVKHGRCPALTGPNELDSQPLSAICGQLYDQAKALETFCANPDMRQKLITSIDDETVLRLVDTPQFRQQIPADERATWMDGDTDLIETGAFRQPGYREMYLAETVNPLLLQLGRDALAQISRSPSDAIEL